MKNKIKLFVLLFTLLLSSFSFENLQNNQRILVESTENNKNEDGSVKINLLRMEVNEIEEGTGFYKIEILYEIDEKYEKDYIYTSKSPFPNECFNDENTHEITSKINGNKGKKLILIEDVFHRLKRGRVNICLKYNDGNEINDKELMSITFLFFAQINLDVNKLPDKSMEEYTNYRCLQLNINGMKSVFWIPFDFIGKLTRLMCFLNLEGPRKVLKNDNFNKAKLIGSNQLKGKKHEEKMEYSHIEICLKFENPGNYFIIVSNDPVVGWLQFYVKIKKAKVKRCVFKMFKKISDLEKKVLKSLRHKIAITISKTDIDDIEDGEMNVDNVDFMSRFNNIKIIAIIEPLIDDGSYEFYLDKDGITKERVKINEANY